MSERSKNSSRRVLESVVAMTLLLGGGQWAVAQVTYTVDRAVGGGRITGIIQTDGNLGVLSATDILGWDLNVDANGDGIFAHLAGPPTGILLLQGTALSATPTGLFWDFSNPGPGPNILQIHTLDVTWRLQAFVPFVDEFISEPPLLQSYTPRGPGVDQIATTVIAPLEITADTTLTVDRHGPIVITADNVRLDCAHHSVSDNPSGIGIHAAGRTGVTIMRCDVSGFAEGIVLEDSSRSVLSENTTSKTSSTGIRLTHADGNRLTGNYVTDTRSTSPLASGLVLQSSSRNRVEFNTVDHADAAGILMTDGSSSNEIVGNVSSLNGGRGFDLSGGSSNTFLRNTAIRNGDFGFVARDQAKRSKLIENTACLNQAGDATEFGAGKGNVWALNLFCSPSF